MKLTVIPDLRFAIAVKGSSATMASEINDNLDRASEVNIELDIASAFVEPKILYLLEDALARAKSGEPSPKIRLVFGVSKRFTPPKAVDKMLRLNNLHRDNITVRVAKDNKFHWKLYMFRQGLLRRFYVGSSNLTKDGLTASGELSVKIEAEASDDITKELEAQFNELWKDDGSRPLDDKWALKYKGQERPVESVPTRSDNEALDLVAPVRAPLPPLPNGKGENGPGPTVVPIASPRTIKAFLAAVSRKDRPKVELLLNLWRRDHVGSPPHPRKDAQVGTLAFFGTVARRPPVAFRALCSELVAEIKSLGLSEALEKDYREQLARVRGFVAKSVMSQTAPRAKFSAMDEDSVREFVRIAKKLVKDW